MGLNQTDQEMVKDITRMGVRAGVLLRGVMLKKVDEETLRWGLGELAAGDLMARYMPTLLNRAVRSPGAWRASPLMRNRVQFSSLLTRPMVMPSGEPQAPDTESAGLCQKRGDKESPM